MKKKSKKEIKIKFQIKNCVKPVLFNSVQQNRKYWNYISKSLVLYPKNIKLNYSYIEEFDTKNTFELNNSIGMTAKRMSF